MAAMAALFRCRAPLNTQRQQRRRRRPSFPLSSLPSSSSSSFSSSSSSETERRIKTKNVLVVGGGGREHALVWGIAKSEASGEVYCCPGNAGIGLEPKTKCVEDISTCDHEQVVAFCREKDIDLVVVGPEAELVAGLADDLRESGVATFGPSALAAQLEGSKTFMKEVCLKYGIPTAAFESFTDAEEAKRYLRGRYCICKKVIEKERS